MDTLQAGEADSPRGAAADRGEGVVEHHAPGRQAVQVGCLARRVPIDGRLETCIVGCKTSRNKNKETTKNVTLKLSSLGLKGEARCFRRPVADTINGVQRSYLFRVKTSAGMAS